MEVFAVEGTLTHVVHWDANSGWQRVNVLEAEKIYGGKTVSSSEEVLMCSLCHDYITLTKSSNKRPAYFKHKRTEQESVKFCPDRSENKVYSTKNKMGIRSAQLPLRLVEYGSKFGLELGVLPEYGNISSSIDERIVIKTDENLVEQKFSLESIDYDKVTYFKLEDVTAKKYYLKLENMNVNNVGLPNSSQGVVNGAFFDKQTKRRIPFNGQIQLGNEYYYVISQDSSKYKDWKKKINITKYITVKQVGYLNKQKKIIIFSIKANKLNVNIASFFFVLGVYLVNKLTKIYPIWPETIQSQYRYFPKLNELILYNPKKYGIILQGIRYGNNTNVDDNVFVYEKINNKDRKRALITSKNSFITDYIFLWQDDAKLTKRKIVENDIVIYDGDGNSDKYKFESYTYHKLPKKKLVIESKDNIEITVKIYADGIPIENRSGRKIRLQDRDIKWGQEIRVYDGFVLLKRLKFIGDNLDLDNKLYEKLLSVQNSEKIKFRNDMINWWPKLTNYSKCRKWLQKCKVRQEIPRRATKILQREFGG